MLALRLLVLVVLTLLAAALGMLLQPLAGKLVLPSAGGTPAIWSVCLVFFQAVLLAGYTLAHRLRNHPRALALAWGLAAAWLWLAADQAVLTEELATQAGLSGAVLAYLAWRFGPPALLLLTTAPTIQRLWTHATTRDPYPLYAMSNAGSLLGLLLYPIVVEPQFPLTAQLDLFRTAWSVVAGFVIVGLWGQSRKPDLLRETPQDVLPGAKSDYPRGKVIGLAALMTAWLGAISTHLTTDLAPVPWLWILPLVLYLGSFMIVFARWTDRARRLTHRIAPAGLVFLMLAWAAQATEPLGLVMGLHLLVFAIVLLLAHGEIVLCRPAPAGLTRFYLDLAVGGVVGGGMVALLAPWCFQRLGMVEYPLCIVLAALIRIHTAENRLRPLDTLSISAVWLWLLVWNFPEWTDAWLRPWTSDPTLLRILRLGLSLGVPAVASFAFVARPVRFAACLAGMACLSPTTTTTHGELLEQTRNFFGQLRVTRALDGRQIRLVHGTTQHGAEWVQEAAQPRPLMYYHPRGPVGRVFREGPSAAAGRQVAAVGLGVGAIAAYARPTDQWTFYEIDPAVARIAQDTRYFHFLSTCQAPWELRLGDARQQLQQAADGTFDLIILDAFSSDAIPTHLLTLEAFQLYTRKLKPRGILLVHLSNRYLDLPPIVATVAAALPGTWQLRLDEDFATEDETADGKFPSTWGLMFRQPEDLGPQLARSARFQPVQPQRRVVSAEVEPILLQPWTDQRTSLRGLWK